MPFESLTYSVPFETDTPVVTVRMGFQDRRLRMVVDSAADRSFQGIRSSQWTAPKSV
jgi:hypothetical protein